MDLISSLMNIIVPPASFFTLLALLPPYYFFKRLIRILGSIFIENVSGKVVLITGASSGIGEHLAYQYASRGACLVLVARREDRLRVVADRAQGYGSPDVLVIPADVSKMDDCRRFVQEAVNHFGHLDHLVNNAGITSICMLEDSKDLDNFRPVMDINFWGAIYPTYFAIPHLRRTNGKIIAMASVAGWLGVPRMGFYSASKAALINFYECLRVEVGSDVGITIVTPGYVESEMVHGKILSKDGNMEMDTQARDVVVGATPVVSAEGCAKGIVNGVCRGEKYITEPAWYNAVYYWKAFCPDVLEWFSRVMHMTGAGISLNKTILDVTGANNFLYPSSIQQPELKAE